jgi:hypothetical protein
MEHFGNTETVPVFFVAFTISTVTASSVLYRDFDDEGAPQIAAFALGCLVTFAGARARPRRAAADPRRRAHLAFPPSPPFGCAPGPLAQA